MAGFWESMKRLVAGEQVFRGDEQGYGVTPKKHDENDEAGWKSDNSPSAPAASSSPPAPAATPTATPTQAPAWQEPPKVGPKVIPVVNIQHIECRQHGDDDMELTIKVRNNALENVMVDKILLFGNTREIDHTLRPGEEREFMVFNGDRPKHTNYTRCELQYRSEAGDYFSAIHNVEYETESDGKLVVKRIRFLPPVKDI